MKRYMKNRNQFLQKVELFIQSRQQLSQKSESLLQSKTELVQNTEPILRRVERLSKQIIYPSRILLFFLVTSLTLFSCDKFLQENPKDKLPEEDVYNTISEVYLNAVASLYTYIGGYSDSQGLQGTGRGVYDLNTFTSDEAIIPTRGGDWYDGGFWQGLYLHDWGVENDAIQATWEYLYKVVMLSNKSLERIDKFAETHSDAVLPAYRAEVQAMRAMSYYGRITRPVVTFLLAKLALNSEVYTDNDWTDGQRPDGKNIKFTVNGNELNAWETVIYYCDQLKAMGYNELEPKYETNFSIFNESSIENIFTIPMNKTLYTNQMQYLFRSRHYNHAKAYGLSGENGPSATIEALQTFGYETDEQDPRFDICYFAGVVRDLKGNIIKLDDGTVLEYLPWKVALDITDTPYEQTAGARMKKYEVDPTATKDGKLMENDIVLFRYADALLMKSEAKVRNGASGDEELNEVRSRVNASSRPATLENILAERQLELAWEGWRRQDLVRFGKFTRAYSSRPQLPDEGNGYTTVFPIPEKIRVMNTKLKQNPGY